MAILKIPVTKAGNRPIEFETNDLPENIYAAALAEGLKVLVNKGMSKIILKGLEGSELDAAHDEAYAKAESNRDKLMSGQLATARASTKTADGKKVPGVVLTEARRLAKEVVKNEIRAAGMKISHVEASAITKAANELIAADPSFIEQATANIEARTAKVVSVNIASLIHESPKLVEAEKVRKAKAAATPKAKVAPRKSVQASA